MMAHSQLSEKQIIDAITCQLCTKFFKHPMRLNTCFHTVCEHCVNHILTTNQNRCPTCLVGFSSNDVSNDDEKELYMLTINLPKQPNTQKEVTCFFCKCDEFSYKCLHCQRFACESCCDKDDKDIRPCAASRSHTFYPMGLPEENEHHLKGALDAKSEIFDKFKETCVNLVTYNEKRENEKASLLRQTDSFCENLCTRINILRNQIIDEIEDIFDSEKKKIQLSNQEIENIISRFQCKVKRASDKLNRDSGKTDAFQEFHREILNAAKQVDFSKCQVNLSVHVKLKEETLANLESALVLDVQKVPCGETRVDIFRKIINTASSEFKQVNPFLPQEENPNEKGESSITKANPANNSSDIKIKGNSRLTNGSLDEEKVPVYYPKVKEENEQAKGRVSVNKDFETVSETMTKKELSETKTEAKIVVNKESNLQFPTTEKTKPLSKPNKRLTKSLSSLNELSHFEQYESDISSSCIKMNLNKDNVRPFSVNTEKDRKILSSSFSDTLPYKLDKEIENNSPKFSCAHSLSIIDNKIWCIEGNKINILSKDGKTERVIMHKSIKNAQAATQLSSGEVIFATTGSGLLLLKAGFTDLSSVREVAKGSFASVTSSGKCVYALDIKEKMVLVFKQNDRNPLELVKVNNIILPYKTVTVHDTIIAHKNADDSSEAEELLICSHTGDKIYCINMINGKVFQEYGRGILANQGYVALI